MKYRPAFPDRFGCIQDSRAFCQTFFPWYNDDHRHSGIGMMTPAMVHYGLASEVRENRLTQKKNSLNNSTECLKLVDTRRSLLVSQQMWSRLADLYDQFPEKRISRGEPATCEVFRIILIKRLVYETCSDMSFF